MSINDTAEVREIFAGLTMEDVQVAYTVGSKADRSPSRRELLINRVG